MNINKSAPKDNLVNELGLQTTQIEIPDKLNSSVQPTFDLRERFTKSIFTATSTTTGTSTIVVANTQLDFYLTFIHLNYTKDAACDNTSVILKVYINGNNINFITIRTTTLTAENGIINIPLPYPIKIDRNTNITLSNSFTVGTMTKAATIGGFYI